MFKNCKNNYEIKWPGDRDSNPRRCYPQRFSRPPLSTTQPSPDILTVFPNNLTWRRQPDLNWWSELCRLVPYRLAMPPCKIHLIKSGARGRTWTGTEKKLRGILSPLCLPIPPPGHKNGAGNESRTRDIDHGKVALYHWAIPASFLFEVK